MRGVRKRGTDLVKAERVLVGYGVGRFTSGEGSNDRRDVNARAGQARLPEYPASSPRTPYPSRLCIAPMKPMLDDWPHITQVTNQGDSRCTSRAW